MSWATKFRHWLIQQGFELWTQRNTLIHENSSQPSTNHSILNQKISHLYSLQSEVLHHDKDIFDVPINDRYDLTEKQKKIWIEQTTTTVTKSIAEQQVRNHTRQKDICQFFTKQNSSQ